MAHRKLIRVGLLGAGRHSTATHGPALRKLASRYESGIELAAVCDLDREKADTYAQTFGFRAVYTTLDDMLAAEKIDALFLITPLALTEKIAADALPRGIPLLIEKPPGTTAAAAGRLRDLARRTGTPHMVSFNRRFNPVLTRAREWLEADPASRRPQLAVSRMLRHNRREPDFVVGTGIHAIDATTALLGRPRAVLSVNQPPDGTEVRFYQASVAFASGCHASFLIAPACGRHEETMHLHGRDFSLDLDFFAHRFQVWREKRVVEEWILPESENDGIADVTAETEAFLNGIRDGRPRPDLEDGLISLQLAEAIQNAEGKVGSL